MKKMPKPKLGGTAPDMCADYLRSVILNGEFKSGQAIVLDQIARDLGVSHTPIREAIRKLEAEGFVDYFPRRGAIVRPTLFEDFVQLVEIRKALEPILLAEAVRNFDDADRQKQVGESFAHWKAQSDPTEILEAQWGFYSAIYDFANKPLVLDAAKANWQHIFRYHRSAWDHREELRLQDVERMQALMDAFQSGNESESLTALNATIDWGYERVRVYLDI